MAFHYFLCRFNEFWDEERRGTPGHPPDEHDGMGFNIFTNPLEMHRYFEQQMNEFLKQFQMEDHGPFSGIFGGVPEFPMIEDRGQEPSGNLREQFIKPGYEKSKESGNSSRKMDTDVDEKFQMGDLDTILKKPERPVIPFEQKPQTEMRVFGQSVQYKTVRNSDGSVEIQKIVKDNSGNEERTITRKFGDKEHTITIKRDREGREERTENLINMNDNDSSQLWGNRSIQEKQNSSQPEKKQGGILSSLFSRFF